MMLVAALYAFVAYLLWDRTDRKGLLLASFLAVLGFFVLAPRMHERYLYTALVVLIPLAIESPVALAMLGGLTITLLFNLVYIKKVLDTNSFLDARDTWAMVVSGVNVAIMGVGFWYGWQTIAQSQQIGKLSEIWRRVERRVTERAASREAVAAVTVSGESPQCPPWVRLDTIIVVALLAAAAFLRFYKIGHPNEIVFDE